MSYKKHRIVIGNDLDDYKYFNRICECCHKSSYGLAPHHHCPQQWTYKGQGYVINLNEFLSMICLQCHSILEHNESQYNRELLGKVTKRPYEYWHKSKSGITPEEVVEEYLAKEL
jgi:hypothetical protein